MAQDDVYMVIYFGILFYMGASLVVLAAGMGSRYGGLKQIDGFGPDSQTILEYSIYDALQAGFNHVVLVIRESFAQEFKKVLGDRFAHKIKVDYAYQSMELDYPGITHITREKPRGTGHAVLVAKSFIDQPFCVINADDYYGSQGYIQMYNFLTTISSPSSAAMVSYPLVNTLSAHGSVNRGICKVDSNNHLIEVFEHLKISHLGGDVAVDEDGNHIAIDSPASMNLLGFHHSFFGYLEDEFLDFVRSNNQETKKEFYIPAVLNSFIHTGGTCTVLTSDDQWYGATYPEDKQFVVEALQNKHNAGVYPNNLWA